MCVCEREEGRERENEENTAFPKQTHSHRQSFPYNQHPKCTANQEGGRGQDRRQDRPLVVARTACVPVAVARVQRKRRRLPPRLQSGRVRVCVSE